MLFHLPVASILRLSLPAGFSCQVDYQVGQALRRLRLCHSLHGLAHVL
jgi:hypothetical protein